MSVQAITYAMALRGVSPTEKLLLLALANYADERMQCWPSQRRLAEDTCLTDRTVRSLLSSLEGREIVSRTPRQRDDHSRTTDVITLHFAMDSMSSVSGGAENISGGVRKQLPGGAEAASGREPSTNPQEENKPSEAADFEAWWQAYPRKESKGTARKAYFLALRKTTAENLLKSLRAATFNADRRYQPLPATWLNGERWLDDNGSPPPEPPEPTDPWRERMLRWSMNQYWNSEWGPKPGKPGCLAPESLLDRAA